MEIISVIPRGYCQGVVRAIKIAQDTAEIYKGQKISMLGMIVHNQYVVDECRRLGINCLENKNKSRLELLDEIEEGVVIFTAHGVSDMVYGKAKAKGLIVIDATCVDVSKTHELVRKHCLDGDIIYIGKKNHPESEGVVQLSERIHLVSTKEDVDLLHDLSNILITNQTTLSVLETKDLINYCLEKFPQAEIYPEICNATTIRQNAVMKLENIDLLIVVGDPHSNNTNQLKKIADRSGIRKSIMIETALQLTEDMLKGSERIAVTSGSSTPTGLTNQVIDTLNAYADTGILKIPEKLPAKIL